jgi:hypothetical protein
LDSFPVEQLLVADEDERNCGRGEAVVVAFVVSRLQKVRDIPLLDLFPVGKLVERIKMSGPT